VIRTYRDLPKAEYPIYPLPSENWHWQDKVLFLDGLVLDEKNMPGKSLGIRRLQCQRLDLFPLKSCVMDVSSFLKRSDKHWIDCKGKPFTYLKTQSSPLKTYKIKRIDRKGTASLLWVHGWDTPFTIARPPFGELEWVRLLHLGDIPWLVYDYVWQPQKPTYRRV
jgi:hypothetical protein